MKVLPVQRDYIELVKCMPLSVIEDEIQYKRMMKIMKELAIKDDGMTRGEQQYFQVLSLLVGNYEEEHFKVEKIAPRDMLRSFMDDRALTQAAIAKISGEYESNISAFLAGKRNLSKHAAKRLGTHFAVDPMIFLPPI